MAQCRCCGGDIIFVDKGTDPHTGKKKWVPVNPDLSPHACNQAPTQTTNNSNGSPRRYEGQPDTRERRICAMWSIGQAIILTAGAPMDLDTRLRMVDEYARRLFALVDVIAAKELVPSPPCPQEPAAVHA